MQPIHVADQAKLAVAWGERVGENGIVDAIGAESYSYQELVKMLMDAMQIRSPMLHMPVWAGLMIGKVFGWFMRDVVITRDEIGGLMDDLLYVQSEPTGEIRLSEWAKKHQNELGRGYRSELARRVCC